MSRIEYARAAVGWGGVGMLVCLVIAAAVAALVDR